jgi:hypothetical protein
MEKDMVGCKPHSPEFASNKKNSLLQGLEEVNTIVDDYLNVDHDSDYAYVKQPILYGPDPIWTNPEKGVTEDDQGYRDDLYDYLGGYHDRQFFAYPYIKEAKRESTLIRLGWFRLTGRQEC